MWPRYLFCWYRYFRSRHLIGALASLIRNQISDWSIRMWGTLISSYTLTDYCAIIGWMYYISSNQMVHKGRLLTFFDRLFRWSIGPFERMIYKNAAFYQKFSIILTVEWWLAPEDTYIFASERLFFRKKMLRTRLSFENKYFSFF
jgi:hypothetical protein